MSGIDNSFNALCNSFINREISFSKHKSESFLDQMLKDFTNLALKKCKVEKNPNKFNKSITPITKNPFHTIIKKGFKRSSEENSSEIQNKKRKIDILKKQV